MEFMDLDSISVFEHTRKELGQYPAILTKKAWSINHSCGREWFIFPSDGTGDKFQLFVHAIHPQVTSLLWVWSTRLQVTQNKTVLSFTHSSWKMVAVLCKGSLKSRQNSTSLGSPWGHSERNLKGTLLTYEQFFDHLMSVNLDDCWRSFETNMHQMKIIRTNTLKERFTEMST